MSSKPGKQCKQTLLTSPKSRKEMQVRAENPHIDVKMIYPQLILISCSIFSEFSEET